MTSMWSMVLFINIRMCVPFGSGYRGIGTIVPMGIGV